MRHLLLILAVPVFAADLPPDKGSAIPESGKRPVVITGKSSRALPKYDLPAGYQLEVVAAAPLVTHPIMGCLDDQGRLFVGDAVGVNWNKAQLEANPPNRVLMLEDTDKDGSFDKSTIFADKMTFPQGACWLKGSLYVASPPGIWKLTDTDNDGVADQREMIVGGFDYTGNAADIHGPFLHPNGRLYWCHGRKGHKVVQKDGMLVDESLACGIWSCKPDGSDIAWHSLGCGDNPVEVDFTPDGDIIGVQNLYYTQPRGDTIVHWLYGGVYERSDQLKAIAHLPRTLETMPVMYNFGHVAVSGCCFWRSYEGRVIEGRAQAPNAPPSGPNANETPPFSPPLQFMVTHFNTQRLVRMELTSSGSTYKAVENEFLKLHNPDIHLTDVMEDPRDGSLLLLDTGGWFRIGCPASLMAKSDLLGAVYRIVSPGKSAARPAPAPVVAVHTAEEIMALLRSADPFLQRRGCDAMSKIVNTKDLTEIAEQGRYRALTDALLDLMVVPLPPAVEHAAMNAYFRQGYDLRSEAANPVLMRRILRAQSNHRGGYDKGPDFYTTDVAFIHVADADAALARTALAVLLEDPAADKFATVLWDAYREKSSPKLAQAMHAFVLKFTDKSATQKLITNMLASGDPAIKASALGGLAAQTSGASNDAWLPALDKLLAEAPTPLVLDAIKKLKSPHFDAALQAIANDTKRPLAIRLKALDSEKSIKLTGETFDMVKGVLADAASSAAAKIQAAGMIAAAPMPKVLVAKVAPLFGTVGPVELKALLPILRKHKDADTARMLATEIAKNPAIASQQESAYRTALADLPPDIFETIILPAYNTAVAATEAKKRQLGPLADKVIASGNAANGKKNFEMGKGTCIACHKIGEVGRPIGPDLSHIGAIRTERDLLESIFFPSNTLARDYEAHVIETSDGQQTLGVIKSHTAEGFLVIDIAGQEKNIAHQTIVGDTTLTTSLMPQGLDQTLPEAELLDLVAWLRSLK
jgi:putative heme-binding domain-containing protein